MRALFLALILLSPPAFAATPPALATVLSVKGLASLEPLHTNLAEGGSLAEGDRVTVMAASRLRLKLASGAVVEVGPHSELVLKRGSGGAPLLRLPHGRLLVVTADSSELEIRTAQLKLNVRAKAFFLGQPLDSAAFVCVCDGEARAKWPRGEAKLSGKKHDHPVKIFPSKAAPVAQSSPGDEHTDSDVDALKKLL